MKYRKSRQLPLLKENERIYLRVPYLARGFAKYCNCGFDTEKKLWFTGIHNSNIESLVDLYGVHKATSKETIQSLIKLLKK